MSDLIPMTAVKVTDFYHQKLCFEYVGASEMMEALEELQKQFPKLPGVGLALATVKAAVSEQRTRMLTRNVTVAMKNGFDPEGQQLGMEVRKDGLYLTGVPMPTEATE